MLCEKGKKGKFLYGSYKVDFNLKYNKGFIIY
ncbi:hypothetical protein GFV14_00589 [Candidatus Hartigia pinicola]|nr:hypothetical protein GFV14_00589 [Candidatus Hartigia pinicola]